MRTGLSLIAILALSACATWSGVKQDAKTAGKKTGEIVTTTGKAIGTAARKTGRAVADGVEDIDEALTE